MIFKCLICGETVLEGNILDHKILCHFAIRHYGFMWPINDYQQNDSVVSRSKVYSCPALAQAAGVKMLYVLNEGLNPSGSMKDFLTSQAIFLGSQSGAKGYTIVSSGNHAVSLALAAQKVGASAIIFVPATSSKIDFLCSFKNTLVFGVQDAIFEDVYSQYSLFADQMHGIYNANVCNESLLVGLANAWQPISNLNPYPTHILSGVGNGSYLAGFYLGSRAKSPIIVPIGMRGAFPTEEAIRQRRPIVEYQDFLTEESLIDAAEGSIAIGSYSMPQLTHAVSMTNGFPLGDLTNEDLAEAYKALCREEKLIEGGIIPEPTGIMGLAAALKHDLGSNSIPVVVFTGHAVKDIDTILRINEPRIGSFIVESAQKSSGSLEVSNNSPDKKRFCLLPKKNGLNMAIDFVLRGT